MKVIWVMSGYWKKIMKSTFPNLTFRSIIKLATNRNLRREKMKIHIIGGPGSGKTFLADNLSKQLGIPHYDLDDLQWDNIANNYGTKRKPQERDKLLNQILQSENWIIEGVYYSWCRQCFEAADKIYVLNVPRYIYRYRIIRRFIRRKLGLEKGKKEVGPGYHIQRYIGKGGMADVYEAIDTISKYEVAIKICRDDVESKEEMYQRFLYEIKIAAVIQNHYNIIKIYGQWKNLIVITLFQIHFKIKSLPLIRTGFLLYIFTLII